ncbi:MAG: hypothetical protein ACLGH8_05425 [Bacteroidia bacterium]
MSFFKFSAYLIFLPTVLLIVAVILGSTQWRRLSVFGKSIFCYLAAMLMFDSLNIFMGYVLRMSNHIILPLFSLTELCFFLYFYNKCLLVKRYMPINVLGVISVLYIVVEFIMDFVIHYISPAEFQPYAKVADNFIIILLALTFLYEKMSTYNESRWNNFRLNMVILVYFTLNTIIFLPFNFLVNENSGVKFYFWTGNVVLLVLFNCFMISEIWKDSKRLKTAVAIK